MFFFGVLAIVVVLTVAAFIIYKSTKSWVEFKKIYRLRGLTWEDYEINPRGHALGHTPSTCPKCLGKDAECILCLGKGVVYIEC